MSTSAATYAPEMQVITLKPEFEAFSDPVNLRGFQTSEQVAIFFHEWIHYLHNVSTVLGLTTFGTLIAVWSNFRATFGADGWSHGELDVSVDVAGDIERQYALLGVLRGRRNTTLPMDVDAGSVSLTRVERVPADEKSPNELSVLECDALLVSATGDGAIKVHRVFIGANEILECAALMLEQRAAVAMKTLTPPGAVNPYLLVPKARDLLAPSLSDEAVLMCALASVQCADPPRALLDLLQVGAAAVDAGDDPTAAIRSSGERLFQAYLPAVEATIAQIKELFPVDEPMARAVLSTLQRIELNLSHRQEDLFFELKIVERLRLGPALMLEAIQRYGAPAIVQKRNGDPDEIGRDLIYSFDLPSEPRSEAVAGWNMLHAAFKFVGAHLRGNQLRGTDSLFGTTCPFYTSCQTQYRRSEPQNCRSAPWLSVQAKNGLCEYASAVVATRPREVSERLAKNR